MKEFNFSR